jgi:hypothetical protein
VIRNIAEMVEYNSLERPKGEAQPKPSQRNQLKPDLPSSSILTEDVWENIFPDLFF